MEIQEQRQGAVVVIRPNGPLTGEDAILVKRRLEEAIQQNLGRVVLDAAAIPYADSQGLEVLVDLTERLEQTGRALKLSGVGETLREALELVGWAEAFEFYQDVQSAVRSFL